jgi:hypothetical protein
LPSSGSPERAETAINWSTRDSDSVTLWFGMWRDDQQRWATATVVDPSRFGMTRPPTSFGAFLAVATSYVNG